MKRGKWENFEERDLNGDLEGVRIRSEGVIFRGILNSMPRKRN